jgi:hypothetical protein
VVGVSAQVIGTSVHRCEGDRQWQRGQSLPRAGRFEWCEALVGDRLWRSDVEVEAERLSDLFVEEGAEAAMLRVDPTDEFALVEAETDCVVCLPLERDPTSKSRAQSPYRRLWCRSPPGRSALPSDEQEP